MKPFSINLKAGILIVISFLFVTFTFYGYQILFTDNLQVNRDDIMLNVPKNATFAILLDSLNKKEILHDKLSFVFLAKVMGLQDSVKQGHYLIPANSSNFSIVKKLVNGRQTPVKLTINNVRTRQDLATKICPKLEMTQTEFLNTLQNDSVLKSLNLDSNTVLTMFIPNTYEVYWTITPKEFIKKMHDEYIRFWNPERIEKATTLGLTLTEVSILASIVEAETNQVDEKATIAGVYYNRLKKNHRLQADPTVKFALNDFTIKRVMHSHLEIDSPYNTYKYKGLPPGPINIPTIISIDAVLNLQQHDYFFFCADPNRPGYHSFTVTFDDHLANGRIYHKILNERKIK